MSSRHSFVGLELLEPRRLLSVSASLIADLNTTPLSSDVVAVQGSAGASFFFHDASGGQHQLWYSDGEPGGAQRVTIPHGVTEGTAVSIESITYFDDRLFFVCSMAGLGRQLFATDGISGVAEPLTQINNLNPVNLTVAGQQLFFFGRHPTLLEELWVTDGTASGTNVVSDLGGVGNEMVALGDRVVFQAAAPGEAMELYISDGTPAGTELLKDINGTALSSGVSHLRASVTGSGPEVFFLANDGVHGREIWRTDGTYGGTVLAIDTRPGSSSGPSTFAASGSNIYYAHNAAGFGTELWVYDADADVASLVKDLMPGTGNSSPDHFLAVDLPAGGLLFTALAPRPELSTVRQYFFTDGTEAGTLAVQNVLPPTGAVVGPRAALLGQDVYLIGPPVNPTASTGQELWRVQSGSGNAQLVQEILPGYGSPYIRLLGAAGGRMLFTADDALHGRELWHAGPAVAQGAELFQNVDPRTANLDPQRLVQWRGEIYMIGKASSSSGLYRTDGTAAGSSLVRGGIPVVDVVALEDRLVLFVNISSPRPQIWTSDGTTAGTQWNGVAVPSSPTPPRLLSFSNRAYYISPDNSALVRTDGTPLGTEQVTPAGVQVASSWWEIKEMLGLLFFEASDPHYGRQLWATDGTKAGTRQLTYGVGSPPAQMVEVQTAAGPRVFFVGNTHEIWMTDGTVSGTERLEASGFSTPTDLVAGDGRLFFLAPATAQVTKDLWSTDGTPAGTHRLTDLTGSSGSNATWQAPVFRAADGLVYVSYRKGSLTELLASDGTPAGTLPAVTAGAGGPASIDNVVATGRAVYFSSGGADIKDLFAYRPGEPLENLGGFRALDWLPGFQPAQSSAGVDLFLERLPSVPGSPGGILYATDGTTAGTSAIPGIPVGSGDVFMTATSSADAWGNAFVRGSDPIAGRELHLLTGPATGPMALTAQQVPGGIELNWNYLASAATGFTIQRQEPGGSWSTIGTAAAGDRTFLDPTAADGTAYVYRLYADRANGPSAASNSALILLPGQGAPAQPTEFVAHPFGPTRVQLYWRDNAPNETGYRVERRGDGSPSWQVIATLPADSMAYHDATAEPDSSYAYRVIATGTTFDSLPSSEALATTPAAGVQLPWALQPTPVPAVMQLEHFDFGGPGISYSDNTSSNASGLLRPEDAVDIVSNGAGGHAILAEAGEWVEYTIKTHVAGTYNLRLRAGADGGGGTFRVLVNGVDVSGPLTVPDTDINGSAPGGYLTVLSRGIPLEAGTSLLRLSFEMAGPSGLVGRFDQLQWIGANIDKPAPVPLNVTAASVQPGMIEVRWSQTPYLGNLAPAQGFLVERRIAPVGVFTVLGQTDSGVMSFLDTTAVPGQAYAYRVTALASGGNSGVSRETQPGIGLYPTELLADVNTGVFGDQGSYPMNLLHHGGKVFMTAGRYGEPWVHVTDGTEEGTVKLARTPILGNPFVTNGLVALGDWVYFTGDGNTLWRTNGDPFATAPAFADLEISDPQDLRVVNGLLYFTVSASDASHRQLWRSDGTEAGTFRLTPEGTAGGAPTIKSATTLGEAYFNANDGIHGVELWKTDGTVAGTRRVTDLAPGSAHASPQQLTAIGDWLLFSATDGTGRRVYAAHGSGAGTTVTPLTGVVSVPTGLSTIGEVVVAESGGVARAFFGSKHPDLAQGALWVTDGTPGGTGVVDVIGMAGASMKYPTGLIALQDRLIYLNDLWSNPRQVRAIDLSAQPGSTVPETLLSDLAPMMHRATFNGQLYLIAKTYDNQIQIHRTDGTAAGTEFVAAPFDGTGSSHTVLSLHAAGNRLYFSGGTTVAGAELWVTDGTAAGTVPARTASDQPLGRPEQMIDINGELWTSAIVGDYGRELWRSDGTAAGTQLVKDIHSATAGSHPGMLVQAMEKIFFMARPNSTDVGLYLSDGFEGAEPLHVWNGITTSIARFHSPTVVGTAAGELLFFLHETPANRTEIWRSDGTAAGTFSLGPIGGQFSGSRFHTASSGGRFYVVGDHATSTDGKRYLWTSDGTVAGTHMVSTQVHPYVGLGTRHFTEFKGEIWFVGIGSAPGTTGLWKTDGTAAGTVFVGGQFDGFSIGAGHDLTAVGDLLFLGAGIGLAGDSTYGLVATDGTISGTSILLDLERSWSSGEPLLTGLQNVHGALIFNGLTRTVVGSQVQWRYGLWRSDGTAAGTFDLQLSPFSSFAHQILPWSGNGEGLTDGMFFIGYDRGVYSAFYSDLSVGGHVHLRALSRTGASINAFEPFVHKVGSTVIFGGQDFFLQTDGTPEGSFEAIPVQYPASAPPATTGFPRTAVLNDTLYFRYGDPDLTDATSGLEVWRLTALAVPPSNLSVLPPGGGRSTGVTLGWQINSVNETAFLIERRLAGGDWQEIDSVPRGSDVYEDSTVVGGNTYEYRVRAVNPAGFSEYSNVAIATPGITLGAPALASFSDTGISNQDNLTSITTPTFLGNAPAGSTIAILADGLEVGRGTADMDGEYAIQITTPLSDGQHSITAALVLDGAYSVMSTPLLITIDTVNPETTAEQFVVNAPSQHLGFTFSEAIYGLKLEDILLLNLTTGQFIDHANLQLSADPGQPVHLSFPGFQYRALPDGNYRVTMDAGAVMDAAGNPLAQGLSFDFFFVNGDANQDRRVNLADLAILRANFGQTGKTFSEGDFTYDGVVNLADLAILRGKFGFYLPPHGGDLFGDGGDGGGGGGGGGNDDDDDD